MDFFFSSLQSSEYIWEAEIYPPPQKKIPIKCFGGIVFFQVNLNAHR